MTAARLLPVWLIVGVGGTLLARTTRRFSVLWLVGALLAAAVTTVETGPGWPGPGSATSGGLDMVLGRPGLGMLAAGTVAIALTMLLSPSLTGTELLVLSVVGAGSTVLLSATMAPIWALGAAVSVGILAVRWIAVAPGRDTLAAGRIGGIGVSCLLGAAPFLAPAGGPYEPRAVLSGSLLAVGFCSLLALAPLGGWGAGVVGAVRGVDLAPWALLLAPSLLLSAMILPSHLVTGGRIPFNNALLVLGLFTAILSGVAASRVAHGARYGRLLIADLGLAAAGVGTTHSPGKTGAFIIILTHLCVAPLLLNPSRGGLGPQRRLTWLALSGVPPTPAFWGRYLVLVGCTATAPTAMGAGIVAVTVLLFVAVEGVASGAGAGEPGDLPASGLQRGVAWGISLAAIAIGLSPTVSATGVFGTFGT